MSPSSRQASIKVVRGLIGILQGVEKGLTVGFKTNLWLWHLEYLAWPGCRELRLGHSQPIE
jgi:hypothetical protein